MLVVAANHKVAVPLDVSPCWVNVSAHELQQRALACSRDILLGHLRCRPLVGWMTAAWYQMPPSCEYFILLHYIRIG